MSENIDEEIIRPDEIEVLEPEFYIEGVKSEVADKVEDILKKGRRYFGSSGASLTHQLYNPQYAHYEINKDYVESTLEAERDITKKLQEWMKNKPGVVLIDSVATPDWDREPELLESGILIEGAVSHVLLIGNEVIIIDTKFWKKKKNIEIDNEGNIIITRKLFEESKPSMIDASELWFEYLDENVSLTGVIVINNTEISVFRNQNWYRAVDYRLTEIDRFIELLDEKWKDYTDDEDKRQINSTLVSQVLVRAIKPFDIRSRVFDMKTLSNFK